MSVSRVPTPYAQLGDGPTALRFYLGDAVDLLGRLPPASIDAIVTSPPYNLGIRYRSYDDGQPQDEYLAWTGISADLESSSLMRLCLSA